MTRPTIEQIQRAVMRSCFVTSEHLLGPSRDPAHVEKRHLAMWLARRLIVDEQGRALGRASYPLIGKAFNRDHSSVMNGVRQTDKRLANDRYLAGKASLLLSLFTERAA